MISEDFIRSQSRQFVADLAILSGPGKGTSSANSSDAIEDIVALQSPITITKQHAPTLLPAGVTPSGRLDITNRSPNQWICYQLECQRAANLPPELDFNLTQPIAPCCVVDCLPQLVRHHLQE